jgi:4'-phosphopantetheinyl transferase
MNECAEMATVPTAWLRARERYELPPEEVHVWRASLHQSRGHFTELMQILSQEEQARAARFHFEADRKRCILGRGALRSLLGHCLGSAADQLHFEYNEFGKPRLAPGHQPLDFNLSHSGDWILIALARGRALGVDVERMRQDFASDEIAARFFSANECRVLASVAVEKRCAAFFSCWTRKEAYLKARGDGLSLALDQFDVALLPGEAPRLIETRHDRAEVDRWVLRALNPGSGYKAALAVEGSGWKLECWDWPGTIAFSS